MARVLEKTLTIAVRSYRLVLSPILPSSCRYHPSCSQYALDALRLWGPYRGTLMAARRVLRCHPFAPGGIDPVVRPGSHRG